jgi:carboxypeptidase C (cathepsin A)
MTKAPSQTTDSTDHPYLDTTPYGDGPTDSVTDVTENAAITHHKIVLGGKTIPYQATAGHLVTVDATTSQPAAKMFLTLPFSACA